jgi:uncharacterized protein (TIGR00299 family) protein
LKDLVRCLFFDTFSGISGDMTVGALLSLGLSLDHLRAQLAALDLGGYHIAAERRLVHGIAATKFDVHLEGEAGHHHHHHHDQPVGHAHGHRTFRDIRALIEPSALDPRVKETSLRIFALLAEAEGRVHEKPAEDVAFHEVGAVDSIVDIVATAAGFVHFDVRRAFVGPLPAGSGIVQSQHGPLPVPPPATTELLRGFDLRLGDGVGELVTPTGAAIIAALATPVTRPLPMRVTGVGYGAGTRTLADRPNLLRLVSGEVESGLDVDEMLVIETNIDDGNPELYDYVMERLFAAGARDVWLQAVQMKKNRPGTQLSVLCAPADRDRLAAIVLTETSAIGVRYAAVGRLKLPREVVTVKTDFGDVRVKRSHDPEGGVHVAPEYDDCARLARAAAVPLKVVYQAAIAAAGRC